MNIGKALQRIRFEKGMNQNHVAKKAKISQTYLSLLEQGKKKDPSREVIRKLCKVYDIPPAVVSWYAVEESDVTPKKKELFTKLKPAIDGLVQQLLTPNNK